MKKQIIILCIITLAASSCKKWIDEVYINPNAPTIVSPELVFPSVHANMARGIQFDSRGLGNIVQFWARTGANDAWDRHGYTAGSDFGGEKWRTHYWNLGQNLIDIIKLRPETHPEYVGASYAMFCWSWLHLADYHGMTIFNQAFDATRLTFTFEDQDVVYQYIMKIADSAAFYLNKAKADPAAQARLAAGDLYFYQGNIDNYLRFAYGAKAKAFHRYWNKSTYKPDSVIKYVDLSFTSAAQDASIKFTQTPLSNDERNFFGPLRNNLATYRQSDYVINIMKGLYWNNVVDPRMAYIFKPSADGQFRGVRVGSGQTFTGTQVTNNFWGFASTVAPATDTAARTYFKNSVPFPLMTYSELQFIKAEAAFKKGDANMALQSYKNGIRGHFDHLANYTGYTPITAAARDAFINDPNISPATASELTRSKIIMQKYIALWGYGFEEAWVDMRKDKYSTDIFPGLTFPATFFPDNGGKPAYRVRPRYNSEYLWNVESLTGIGGFDLDYHTKEVWFVKP